MDTFEKHVFVAAALLISTGIMIAAGAMLVWAITNFAQAILVVIVVTAFVFVVHVLVSLVNWDKI